MLEMMQPAIQEFVSTILTGVVTVLGGCLIVLCKEGLSWLKAKVQQVNDEKLRNSIADAVGKLESVVTVTVTSLQETLGDDIKESILEGDGKFTEEDLYGLKDKALETIKSQLTSSTVEVLNLAYNDLDEIIKDMIEVAVRGLKDK